MPILTTILTRIKKELRKLKNKLLEIWYFFNDVETYAASLSFYALSALVPLVVIVLSVALNIPQFSSEVEGIKGIIMENVSPSHSEIIAKYLDTFMENSKSLGSAAFIYIFVASILFFRNFEKIATKLFDSEERKFFDALIVYWSLITLFPIGISLSFYLSAQVEGILKNYELSLSRLWSYGISWALFFILFKILSNKPLPLFSLLLSSLITAICWTILKWGFVYYVFLNKTYASIYGSFSVIMFFILWNYCSWLVILYGMRLCQGFISDFKKENDLLI